MNDLLTEEQMRIVLFGSASPMAREATAEIPIVPQPTPSAQNSKVPTPRSSSPRLRVTLHATKEFEGDVEVLVHESSTLSTLLAEQEAKQAAKKKKFKYFDVVSVVQI